jgi:Mg-chelatase subunit ChlD
VSFQIELCFSISLRRLQTCVECSPLSRTAVSISLVLDKSGSMAGQKLDLVKKTCNFLLKQLKNDDTLSMVVYDSQVRPRTCPTSSRVKLA